MPLTSLLLLLTLAPACAFALDWTEDPISQLQPLLTELPPPVAERLECRPEVIAAFKEAWRLAGSGRRDYEAAFRIDPNEDGYAIEFMPMTREPYQMHVQYYPRRTAAIVHTHPDTAAPTPGPGDYDSKVPNFVVSKYALYATIPGTKRHRFVRGNWKLPCAAKA